MTYEYKVSHRSDGTVSSEQFWKEGLRQREGDRPAWVGYRADGSVEWELFYKSGQLHREGDRPAVVWYRADGSVDREEFFKEGQQYTPSKAKPCEGKTVEIDGVKYILTPVD